MTENYKPIACGTYDELESLAVQRTICQIQFQSEDSVESVQSRIVDIYSRNKEEFIKIEDGREIRLDRLHSLNGNSVGDSCSLD